MYEAEDKHPGPTGGSHGPSHDSHGPPSHLNRDGVKKEEGEYHSKEATEAAQVNKSQILVVQATAR